MGGSTISKILIVAKEPAWTGRKVHLILVNEPLGLKNPIFLFRHGIRTVTRGR